jgi:hypothetical protein
VFEKKSKYLPGIQPIRFLELMSNQTTASSSMPYQDSPAFAALCCVFFYFTSFALTYRIQEDWKAFQQQNYQQQVRSK